MNNFLKNYIDIFKFWTIFIVIVLILVITQEILEMQIINQVSLVVLFAVNIFFYTITLFCYRGELFKCVRKYIPEKEKEVIKSISRNNSFTGKLPRKFITTDEMLQEIENCDKILKYMHINFIVMIFVVFFIAII